MKLAIKVGDSWVHYPGNLCEALGATGRYRIEGAVQPGRPLGRLGLSLREMAQGEQLDAFTGLLAEMLRAGERSAALLLSGGGNDAVRDRLARMLKARSVVNSVDDALIGSEVEQLVDIELREHWTRIFDTLATAWGQGHLPVPVLVHGYDRPVPDGRNLMPSQRFSWLWYPITHLRGYSIDEGRQIMTTLIGRLNGLLRELAGQYPFVVHVDLQGTLRNTSILQLHWGTPLVVNLLAGGAVAMAAGVLVGLPSLRVKGLYLAIATIAAGVIAHFAFSHFTALTGGTSGLSVPPAQVFGRELDTTFELYWVIVPVTLLLLLGAANLFRTRIGRAFIAIRDRDISAEVLGIPLLRYKLLSFAISSFYAGVAGGLFAYFFRAVTPESFPLLMSIFFLAAVIVGGMGTVLAPGDARKNRSAPSAAR